VVFPVAVSTDWGRSRAIDAAIEKFAAIGRFKKLKVGAGVQEFGFSPTGIRIDLREKRGLPTESPRATIR